MLLLFLWPFIEYIGTHDSDKEAHDEWIMHLAVAILLRRGEITPEDGRIINPIGMDGPDLATRLESLGPFARQSVEREMIIEEVVQVNKRGFGPRR